MLSLTRSTFSLPPIAIWRWSGATVFRPDEIRIFRPNSRWKQISSSGWTKLAFFCPTSSCRPLSHVSCPMLGRQRSGWVSMRRRGATYHMQINLFMQPAKSTVQTILIQEVRRGDGRGDLQKWWLNALLQITPSNFPLNNIVWPRLEICTVEWRGWFAPPTFSRGGGLPTSVRQVGACAGRKVAATRRVVRW